MTAWTTISNALVAVGAKPFATTVQALRDNPLAIAEADSTVPLNLLPSVFLGTITTTAAATSVNLGSLDLTPFKFIRCMFNISLVSGGGAGDFHVTSSLSSRLIFENFNNVTQSLWGGILIDLATGVWTGGTTTSNGAIGKGGGLSGITNATTTITFVTAGGGTFDGGTIRIYGEK